MNEGSSVFFLYLSKIPGCFEFEQPFPNPLQADTWKNSMILKNKRLRHI